MTSNKFFLTVPLGGAVLSKFCFFVAIFWKFGEIRRKKNRNYLNFVNYLSSLTKFWNFSRPQKSYISSRHCKRNVIIIVLILKVKLFGGWGQWHETCNFYRSMNRICATSVLVFLHGWILFKFSFLIYLLYWRLQNVCMISQTMLHIFANFRSLHYAIYNLRQNHISSVKRKRSNFHL